MEKYDEKNMKDWSEHYKAPMTENYQASESQYAGKQCDTLSYMERRDRTQEKIASKIRSQNYYGRYE